MGQMICGPYNSTAVSRSHMMASSNGNIFRLTGHLCITQNIILLSYIKARLYDRGIAWWRHQMETSSALLAICAGNLPVTGEFTAQWPVTRSFDVFFDLCLNKLFTQPHILAKIKENIKCFHLMTSSWCFAHDSFRLTLDLKTRRLIM